MVVNRIKGPHSWPVNLSGSKAGELLGLGNKHHNQKWKLQSVLGWGGKEQRKGCIEATVKAVKRDTAAGPGGT